MNYYSELKQVFIKKKILSSATFSLIPALLFFLCALLLLRYEGYETSQILGDAAQTENQSSLIGFISNIGSFLWVSAATICFFSATTAGAAIEKGHQNLLFIAGLFTALLAIDDFFLIHDRYINQKICYLFYAVIMFVLLGRYFKKILEVDGFSFLLAGFLLGSSIFTDFLQNHLKFGYDNIQMFEEGFKFTGAAMWLYFCCCLGAYRK